MTRIELSIITPCFNEEINIVDCSESVKNVMTNTLPGVSYEHIFIDNYSTDATVKLITELCLKDPRIKLLVNSKNLGAFKSIFLALKESSGRAIVPMFAADLQDPAEIIPQFYTKWLEGYLTVFGIRANRREKFLLKSIRSLYYTLIQKLSSSYIPVNAGEFLLADRKIIDSILATKDFEPYIRGMIANVSSKSTEISYNMVNRKKGKSKTSVFKLFEIALNGLISTTKVPARLVLMSGLILSILTVSIVLIKVTARLVFEIDFLSNLTFNTSLILLIGGIQIFFLGLIGEYVLSLHSQVRRVPESFFIKKVNF
jgi:glycosyltransferase involved in cell wall biosynthesis